MDTVPNSEDEFSSLTIASNVSFTLDDPVMAHPTGTGIAVEMNETCGTTRAASVCSLASVVPDKTAPRPGAQPPSPTEVPSGEESPSLTSVSRKAESLKSTTADTEPDSEELCAAILLACLFCQPLDCLLATVRGCNSWICSLCTSACGCKSSSLQPLVGVGHQCDPCGCVGPHCCSVCDICRQTTECLDFGMEISQMLYH
ncbi:myoD family inhibitor domain-containing protein 2 [Takifugu rubripes]|uniref:myoD family inhibitor domain-containing protein 2 n=1 Tax=Takifugu rubripes TaxID=31033 RepID=UPI0011456172|nr:myoD family inhibitor domain-containing protein 2-like [Takifugu rubripes]